VDVLIGMGEQGPGIHARPLYEETMVLVGRARHPTVRGRVSRAQLAGLRHVEVQVAAGRGNRSVAASYAALGIERDIALVVPTFAAAAAVAAGSDLVASLPASVLEVLGRGLGLHKVSTPLPPMRSTINLLWHERTHTDPVCSAFRAVLIDAVAGRGRASRAIACEPARP
jgi:DNA-binding transcriptional LysR family regulator